MQHDEQAVRESAKKLAEATRVGVLTGAGVSAESGVPTFRGPQGLWRKFRPEELATPEAFARDPKLSWEWYDWRRQKLAACKPNAGHEALVRLERSVAEFTLVTQNVDGLHRAAGSRNVQELHGNIWRLRCTICSHTAEDFRVPLPELPPRCDCGGLLRPDVVWFGEMLPEGPLQQLVEGHVQRRDGTGRWNIGLSASRGFIAAGGQASRRFGDRSEYGRNAPELDGRCDSARSLGGPSPRAPAGGGNRLRRVAMNGLAPEDRPREKLFARGAEVLGTNELLAVVLGTGTRNLSALELANQILSSAGGLEGLARSTPDSLARFKGLKSARTARLVAALELGRRSVAEPPERRPIFRTPDDAGRYLLPRFGAKPVEEFGVLVLDTRNRLKRLEVISRGSLNGSLVHPREVFREAVSSQAAGLILFHNHPSGDPTPSKEDLALTRRLKQAGSIMGIEVLDHVILGQGQYASFKEKGIL